MTPVEFNVEEVAGSAQNLAELRRLLAGWRCCGSPALCGATCQDDELSSVLAAAARLVCRGYGPCDRCGSDDTVGFADYVCVACDHVALCGECFEQHRREALVDDTYRHLQLLLRGYGFESPPDNSWLTFEDHRGRKFDSKGRSVAEGHERRQA